MAEPTTDQYERQLYSMFKSFDVNDEESLDESAVTQLCDALQLEERGAALVGALFERRPGRASFQQFRAALLRELGEPREPGPGDPGPSDPAPRPPRAAAAEPAPARARLRRAASASAEPPLEHGRPLGRDEALALCRALRMPSIDRHLVERIFDESSTAETTVGEFFERLNSSLAAVVREGGTAGDEEPPATTERVLEAWEGAGVRRPRRLLADLGFVGAAARLPDLERALDEELRAAGPEPAEGRAALLAAALAVSRLRAAGAAERRAAAAAERDKLRADLAAADERARLLAREVDESHARLETDLKASLRRAEARLADEARRAAADAAAERERAAAERAALEADAARARDAEAGLRAEAAAERARADCAEARAAVAEERAESAECGAARAADELRAARAEAERAVAAAEALRGAGARAEELARDNQRLRDRAGRARRRARGAALRPRGSGERSTPQCGLGRRRARRRETKTHRASQGTGGRGGGAARGVRGVRGVLGGQAAGRARRARGRGAGRGGAPGRPHAPHRRLRAPPGAARARAAAHPRGGRARGAGGRPGGRVRAPPPRRRRAPAGAGRAPRARRAPPRAARARARPARARAGRAVRARRGGRAAPARAPGGRRPAGEGAVRGELPPGARARAAAVSAHVHEEHTRRRGTYTLHLFRCLDRRRRAATRAGSPPEPACEPCVPRPAPAAGRGRERVPSVYTNVFNIKMYHIKHTSTYLPCERAGEGGGVVLTEYRIYGAAPGTVYWELIPDQLRRCTYAGARIV